MPNLLRRLSGGDRRSIGESDKIAGEISENTKLFAQALDAMLHADSLVRMRAADAVEKASCRRPELLLLHKRKVAIQDQRDRPTGNAVTRGFDATAHAFDYARTGLRCLDSPGLLRVQEQHRSDLCDARAGRPCDERSQAASAGIARVDIPHSQRNTGHAESRPKTPCPFRRVR